MAGVCGRCKHRWMSSKKPQCQACAVGVERDGQPDGFEGINGETIDDMYDELEDDEDE